MGARNVFLMASDTNQRCPGKHMPRVAINGFEKLIVHCFETAKMFINTTLDKGEFTTRWLLHLPYFAQKSQFFPALLSAPASSAA
jgi:hypothetical protein